METEIIEKLKKIIEPYIDTDEVDIKMLNKSSHLITDLGLDSFYVIDIVLDIENEFDIAIDDDSIATFENVGVVVKVIKEKLKESQ